MKSQTCRWCLRPASGIVTAGSGDKRIVAPHCDEHWDDAYRLVKDYPSRTWKTIKTDPTLF
jgi:hypothetical protein